MSDTEGRVCKRCGIFKSYEGFYRKKSCKNGYNSVCRSCCILASRENYQANRDDRVSRQSDYNHEHKDFISSKAREKRRLFPELVKAQEKKRYLKNRDKRLNLQLKYQKENPDKVANVQGNRRARKAKCLGSFSFEEWTELCNRYDNKCLACGEKKPLSRDHVIPIALGGNNTIDNIQPLCRSCNSKKHTDTTDYRY